MEERVAAQAVAEWAGVVARGAMTAGRVAARVDPGELRAAAQQAERVAAR